jgi:hypothetical protein
MLPGATSNNLLTSHLNEEERVGLARVMAVTVVVPVLRCGGISDEGRAEGISCTYLVGTMLPGAQTTPSHLIWMGRRGWAHVGCHL